MMPQHHSLMNAQAFAKRHTCASGCYIKREYEGIAKDAKRPTIQHLTSWLISVTA